MNQITYDLNCFEMRIVKMIMLNVDIEDNE